MRRSAHAFLDHVPPRPRWLINAPPVVLRPMRSGDTETVSQVFAGMSAQSRYLRFCAPVPRLTASMLAALARVDHDRQEAWVAYGGGRPVGIGRYVVLPDEADTAEVAFEVIDAYQGRGVGRALLDELHRAAARRGLRWFSYAALPDNWRALRLLGVGDAQTASGETASGELVEGRVPVCASTRTEATGWYPLAVA